MSTNARLSFAHRQIPALDGLRGAAVMLVITYHFGFLRFGWTGVGLFYVLSGYLITSILLETRDLGLGKYLGRFYWRRTLRIFPLYFGFVLAVMAVWLLTGRPSGAGNQFPWLATFTYNLQMAVSHKAGLEQTFHHLWSISTEEQFYLLWPLLVWLLGRRGIGGLAIAMILLAPAIRYFEPALFQSLGIQMTTPGKLIYYLPFGHIDAFAIGGIVAAVVSGPWTRRPLLWGLGAAIPVAVIVLRELMRFATGQIPELTDHLGFPMSSTTDGFHIWGYSAAYLLYGGMLVLVLYGPSSLWIKRLASWEPAGWVGKISYSMYVFHWPLLLVLESMMPLHTNLLLRLVQFKVYMIVLVGLSWVSHRYFESWFLKQKERFFSA